MKKDKNLLRCIKLGLLGDSGLGKTSICNTFYNLEFTHDTLDTLGTEKNETKFTLENGGRN